MISCRSLVFEMCKSNPIRTNLHPSVIHVSLDGCTVKQAIYRCYHRLISWPATLCYCQLCWLFVNHNLGYGESIVKIWSLQNFSGNSVCNYHKHFHLTLNVLQHYFVIYDVQNLQSSVVTYIKWHSNLYKSTYKILVESWREKISKIGQN